ncbi:unnamed protein product [Ectocarpus sp. 4 AP-2014]
MCICLNCGRINWCRVYFIIEEQHEEKTNSINKSFSPQAPILLCINFFSKNTRYVLEWDVNECLSYQEKPGSWLDCGQKNLELSSYLIFDLLF